MRYVAHGKVGGQGASSPRKIWLFRVSEITSGTMCEAKMHCAEVVALWYICIIKSVCGLLKSVTSLFADI